MTHQRVAMYFLKSLPVLTLLLQGSFCATVPVQHEVGNVRDIYQFPKPTWIENLAVRGNGKILLTLLTSPDLYQADPFAPGDKPKLIHNFAPYQALTGITEVEPDIFAVATGNFSALALKNSPGSYAVWKVNVRESPPVIKKIADIRNGQLLNGLTLLDAAKKTILIADSTGGVVFRLNTETGRYKVVLDDPILKGLPGGPLQIGVNGIRVVNNTLFFTTGDQNLFASVPITREGTAIGAFKVIVHNTVGRFDDFALSPNGNAFITQGSGNQIAKVTPRGIETEVAGGLNSTTLPGGTAAKFGRTAKDKRVLYVTTNGGLAGPVNGTVVVGGKLAAVTI